MRRLALLVTVATAGCQCLVPVDETRDAGRHDAGAGGHGGAGGGTGGGTASDGGTPQGCTTAADCVGSPLVVSECSFIGADGGFACLDRKCVAQCGFLADLTCAVDPLQHCLQCPPSASCIPIDCGGGFPFTYTVAEVRCAGVAPVAVGDLVREAPDGGCAIDFLLSTDGGEVPFGTMYLQDGRTLTVDVPMLGGTCLALELPTNAPRLIFECPLCQVALGP
jgi:hypothetical protein